MSHAPNRRILTVDDTPSIHDDYRKILGAAVDSVALQRGLASARAAFFGTPESSKFGARDVASYSIDSALQGEEALALVKVALQEKRPYALAFVDIRMPPGWDGVRTIQELWKVDPSLQCVICTAFSDYSWEQMVETLGRSDSLLILKKPFDAVEIRQLATALTEKWNSTAREHEARRAIEAKEAEARAYAASLETANQALRTSKASADRAADVKRAFLERLTHDVGESLGRILEDLVQHGPTVGLEETLDRSHQLLETITRALDLSRLEQGTLGVQRGPCDVVEIVEELAATHRVDAEAKGLCFELQVGPEVPRQVECDGPRLRQVLDQLLSNANRFTEEGFVRLRVHSEPSASWTTVRLRFDIEDSGAGIHPAEQGSLFEPFHARSRGRSQAGSGLGLAVVKQFARLLGGEVTFEPRAGGGTVFRFALEARRL
jgi:two-component system sensor histidine kinase/response regulator